MRVGRRMHIGLNGETDLRMAQAIGQNAHIRFVREKERGVRVTRVMEFNAGDIRAVDKAHHDAADVAGIERGTQSRCADQIALAPCGSDCEALPFLRGAV